MLTAEIFNFECSNLEHSAELIDSTHDKMEIRWNPTKQREFQNDQNDIFKKYTC